MSQHAADSRLRRWPALLARVIGWLVVVVYVAGLCTSYWLERSAGLPNKTPVDEAMLQVGFGAFAVVGALLVAKRPTNALGWIMASVAIMVAIFHTGDTYTAAVMVTRGRPDMLAVVSAWVGNWYWYLLLVLVVIFVPLLFPDGRLPSRRWLPLAVLPGIGTLAIVVLSALVPVLQINESPGYEIENPIGIDGLDRVEALPIFAVLNGLLLVGVVGAAASVVVRFRRSQGIERQQMKWFVYAAALILPVPVVDRLPDFINGVWLGLVLIAMPTAIGVAVLRYRLYDIDLVINRTLVYGPLTAMLVLVYVGGVVSFQNAFRTLTGQESQIAVVASTLAIAALFNPLRGRLQTFVDRRFYRTKYDAAKTLASFSARLRDETNLDALNTELVKVVQETMQPAYASLWLRPDPATQSPPSISTRFEKGDEG
jgi:hypothetical protein